MCLDLSSKQGSSITVSLICLIFRSPLQFFIIFYFFLRSYLVPPNPPSPSVPFISISHYFLANSNANCSFERLMFWLITYCAERNDSTWNLFSRCHRRKSSSLFYESYLQLFFLQWDEFISKSWLIVALHHCVRFMVPGAIKFLSLSLSAGYKRKSLDLLEVTPAKFSLTAIFTAIFSLNAAFKQDLVLRARSKMHPRVDRLHCDVLWIYLLHFSVQE